MIARVEQLPLTPLDDEWTIEDDGEPDALDGETSWYVVGPFGQPRFGPYASAAVAERMLPMLRTRFGDPWT